MQNGTLIILQGIPFCNIDCSYCYLPNRSDTTRMPLHVARAVFRRVFESRRITEPITFLWHAGEPLALPASVYAELFDIAHSENRRYQKKFTFSIQTNGTLIDNRWIELFRRHQVQIGVSVDGPAFIHDFNRRDRSGRPTHARTMAGVKLLQEAGLKTPVITVLSDHSLDYPDQMFEFFEANDLLKIGLNVEATTGTNCSSTVESYQRVVAFFQRFIERVSKSDKTFEVRELGLAYGTFRTLDATIDPPSGRSSTSEPFDIITIDRQGDYSTFCPELRGADAPRYFNFKMGNVLHDAFDGMVDNPVFKLVDQEIKHGLSRCHDSCPYWFTCFGGTPSSKFFKTGGLTPLKPRIADISARLSLMR
jgi:uncharacterized protein